MDVTRQDSDRDAPLRQLLDERWTCRQFLPDQVKRPIIEHLLEMAQRTPSWCNTQPWQVIVTEGDGTERFRKGLAAHAAQNGVQPDIDFPARYSGIYQERRRECGTQLYRSIGIDKTDRAASAQQTFRNFEFFDAPHVAVLTTEAELGTYGAIDCGLYINTFLLSAHSLGLATAPQAAIASQAPFLRQYFGLPEHRLVVAGISFGYPDPDHPINSFRTTRAATADVVTWHSA